MVITRQECLEQLQALDEQLESAEREKYASENLERSEHQKHIAAVRFQRFWWSTKLRLLEKEF
jgi:hypothetical protein